MIDPLNPPDSIREALRDTVALYRHRRDHPNWLNDRWNESFDESFATIADAPLYVDQLTAFAGRLLTGYVILDPKKQESANAAGRQLLLSELTQAEQASIEPRAPMIYKPTDRPDSFPQRAELRGISAAAKWMDGRDPQEIRYVAGFDWTTEHLPPSVLPFLPDEPMTTEEATTFFDAFTAACRAALAA